MIFLLDSIKSASLLVVSLDREVFSIVSVSLKLSSASTLFANMIGIPLGFYIAFESFPGKRMVITCLNTLLSLPTVVIGLFVYAFVARRGLFGPLGLLYTQKAIIIGQTLLIVPLVTSLSIAAISRIDERYRKTAMTLGANRWQTAQVILREARFGIMAALIASYGRVLAEVGISMMLGGNARGFTRTITTAMALEYDKGQFTLALALGMILLGFSFTVNLLFHGLQGKART
jgi:tungstate transport system permease protein